MMDRIRRLALGLRKPPMDGATGSARIAKRFAFAPTVGIGISARSVRAVGVSGDAIRWSIDLERNEGEPLSDTITALVDRSPIALTGGGTGSRTLSERRPRMRGPRGWQTGGWLRPRVVVAIGPSAVQLKRLTGLPPLTDAAALEALVREGAGRFFLRNGVPLITTGVRLVKPGTVWAAAFEAPVVDEVERACRTADLRLQAMVPTATALAHAMSPASSGEIVVWTDGDVRTELTFSEGRVASVRRLPSERSNERFNERSDACNVSGSTGTGRPSPIGALEKLGERSLDFADAYGAARMAQRLGRDEPLILRAGSTALGSSRHKEPSRSRLVMVASVFLVAASSAVAGPALVAAHTAHDARARLRSMGEQVRRAERDETELSRVSRALAQVASFESSRRSATTLLGNLTRALPKEAALVALDVDTTGGTLVALGARASQVTTALEKVKEIASPEIVGPVTREAAGSREVERVTVRFRVVR